MDDIWIDGRMYAWIHGCMVRWQDGWMNSWITTGWMDQFSSVHLLSHVRLFATP